MLLFHNLGEIEIVNCRLFSELIQVHNVLILTKLHISSYAMSFSSLHCACYTQSFGINSAAGYYCDLSSCSPVVPVKAVLPVRVDSAEINHSREAGKVHLGLALSFGRARA